MIEAVLFEFDGVLAETWSGRRLAFLEALAEEGIRLTEAEYREWCATLPVRDAFREALALRGLSSDDTAIDLLTLGGERRFAQWVGKGVSLTDGARELLDDLVGRARLGIVARAARREVEFVLNLARLEHAFEVIVAAEDAFPPKPSRAPYEAALDRLERRRPVRRSAIVALEDGVAGIHAARAAGVRCIAVGDLPAHLAMDADAYTPTLRGQSLASLEALLAGAGESIR